MCKKGNPLEAYKEQRSDIGFMFKKTKKIQL
jgi:hypothetical protein